MREIGVETAIEGGEERHTTLLDRFEAKLQKHQGNLLRSAVDLAKDWRTDRALRHLEAMLIVADREATLVITGNGDVLEPDGGIAAIGSGGNYALAAGRALSEYEKDAEKIATKAMAGVPRMSMGKESLVKTTTTAVTSSPSGEETCPW